MEAGVSADTDPVSPDWGEDPWMAQLFFSIAAGDGEAEYGPGVWFRWAAAGCPPELRPAWLANE